jgi:uncharacterized membrane protein YeiH
MLFEAMDLGATFVFAVSGTTSGVRRRLDLFGDAAGLCLFSVTGTEKALAWASIPSWRQSWA